MGSAAILHAWHIPLTQERDSGCNSHNRCGFDQNNFELSNMYLLYRLFN
jgi:hypothetical protein